MREWLSGRALPCQGKRREFESRFPLHKEKDTRLCVFFFMERELVDTLTKRFLRFERLPRLLSKARNDRKKYAKPYFIKRVAITQGCSVTLPLAAVACRGSRAKRGNRQYLVSLLFYRGLGW